MTLTVSSRYRVIVMTVNQRMETRESWLEALLGCFFEYTSRYFTHKSWLLVTTKYFGGTSPPSLCLILALLRSISLESE